MPTTAAERNAKWRRKALAIKLTAEIARELFSYDADTGALTWRRKRGGGARTGDPAGGTNRHRQGYIPVHIYGRSYLAHRLIWLYVTGDWPEREVDHIDLNKENNRWANLREAAPHQNCANRKVRSDSRSGLKGVFAQQGRWRAIICVQGKRKDLGYYDSPEDAHNAYLTAAKEIHGEYARS